jgi:long-chain acyl-CoA synthetase
MVTEQKTRVERPWLSHYDPGVPAEIEIPPLPVDGLLRLGAERRPDRAALVFFGARTTYTELDRSVDRFALALRGMGVEKGDRVSLHLPTSPAFVIAFLGALRAGALAVPMNPLYVERELSIMFEQTEPKVSVALDLVVPRLRGLADRTGPGRPGRLVVAGIQDSLPVPIRWLYPLKARREGRWRPQPHTSETPNLFRLLGATRWEPVAAAASLDDVAVLQPTGGTTGTPKTAMLTHRNLVANAIQTSAWFPSAAERDHTTVLCALPFFHIYGLTVAMNYGIFLGATLILIPRFDADQILAATGRHRPQLFPGAPIMYDAIARHPKARGHDLSSLEACISGAAPLPGEVQRAFEEITGARVSEGYGLTEAAPVTHCNPIDGDRRLGTIGLPFPSTDARVVNPETGATMAPGEVGELEVAGPQVMVGYWQKPDESAAVLHDGWLRTGDLATCDADGYFRIVDRAKDLVIVGGMNVYPREVEEVLLTHGAVVDAAVVGVPDAHYGEKIHAFVVLSDGATATVDDLTGHCRENLSRYKVPAVIEIRASLPKSMVGKVLRKDLRAEVAARMSTPT